MKFVPAFIALAVTSACSQLAVASNLPNFNILAKLPSQPTENAQVSAYDHLALQAPAGIAKAGMQNKVAAENHLRNLVAIAALDEVQLAGIELQRIHDTGRGAIVARFHQTVDGVPVFGSDFALVMDRNHRLISTSGQLSSHVQQQLQFSKQGVDSFTLPVESLVSKAFVALGGQPKTVNQTVSKVSGRSAYNVEANGPVQLQRAHAEKIYFATAEGLVPAYKLELQTTGSGSVNHDAYAFIYSAQNGQLLLRKNQTQYEKFGYRVFADDNGVPWDGPQGREGHPHPTGIKGQNFKPTFSAPNLVVLEKGPISTNDPWLANGATETNGNNVDAYVDQIGSDGYQTGDVRGVANGLTANNEKTFDYVLNTEIAANADNTQKSAAAVEMFYMINWLHDWFYDHGFNEAAGNAQKSNYGRGGREGDPLRAEAQDKEGFNNASMSTPSDGIDPTMQMYLYTFAGDSKLVVNSPSGIAAIDSTSASFGPQRFAPKTANLVLVQDGVVGSNDTSTGTVNDGCEALTNAAELSGKIALIERGLCNFTVKVKRVQDAGAIAAVIYNKDATAMIALGGDDNSIDIPAIGINRSEGENLKSLSANVTVSEPVPSRDSSFDVLTIAHEWGHYITNRMIGNGGGLDNNQGRSMGEGWGDFHALLLTVEERDLTATAAGWDAKWAMGGYSDQGKVANDTYFVGIRGYPYTTDMDATNGNPLTFKHIKANPQVHGSGTFWATVLWDCYVTLLKNHPFADAQQRMKDYLVASYASTPSSPTFTEARDALLNVVKATDEADYQRMLAAFARRGMGVGAVSPERFDTTHSTVVESFSVEAVSAPAAATVLPLATEYQIPADGNSVSIPVRWTATTGTNVTSYALLVNNVAQTAISHTPSSAALDITTNYTASTVGSLQFAVRLCNGTTCTDSPAISTSVKKAASSGGGGGGGGGGGSLSWWLTLASLPLLTLRQRRRG